MAVKGEMDRQSRANVLGGNARGIVVPQGSKTDVYCHMHQLVMWTSTGFTRRPIVRVRIRLTDLSIEEGNSVDGALPQRSRCCRLACTSSL